MGFTDDRKYLWAAVLDDSKNLRLPMWAPALFHPKLVKGTIGDLSAKDGYAGPHTYYATCPARNADRQFYERRG